MIRRIFGRTGIPALALAALLALGGEAGAFVQFPYDIDNNPVNGCGNPAGAGDVDWNGNGTIDCPPAGSNLLFKHLGASDGFATMADGSIQYTFGFMDLTGVPESATMEAGEHKAEISAPTVAVKEGEQLYLTLTNVGMRLRPDLFDAHTVHFHGYPQAASIFDGEPMASLGIRMMHDLTYYYTLNDPGTYMYHCHVEATEHMEMGMLGNWIVRPADYDAANPATWHAYNNDGGLSNYDVEAIIQYTDIAPNFHEADRTFQSLPFAEMDIRYPLLNGRGYPDTVKTTPITTDATGLGGDIYDSQKISSLITATAGQRILIRLSDLSVETFVNFEIPGLPFRVVGKCARLLRNAGPDGIMGTADDADLSYEATTAAIAPGESMDIVIDTTGVAPGTYYLYARNLNLLNNDQMDRGGAMTEIRIN